MDNDQQNIAEIMEHLKEILPADVYEYLKLALKEQVVDPLINGLYTDGAHHKQWYMERILENVLGCGRTKVHHTYKELYNEDESFADWDEGIEP